VVPADALVQENVISQFNILQQIKEGRQKPELKTILDNSFGSVRPGEMLLVLGRPGSGCTTLLKMLANKRKGCVKILTRVI
jgi:ABC-type multidrug transport system ATPase subunit